LLAAHLAIDLRARVDARNCLPNTCLKALDEKGDFLGCTIVMWLLRRPLNCSDLTPLKIFWGTHMVRHCYTNVLDNYLTLLHLQAIY